MAISTMFCITGKAPIGIVMQQVVHDIVGHHGDGYLTEYLVHLGCNKPKIWIKLKHLQGFLDLDLLIKKQALDAGVLVSPADISCDDNVNIVLYNEFCQIYMADTRNKKSPWWDGLVLPRMSHACCQQVALWCQNAQ